MIEALLGHYAHFMELSKANPVVSSAVAVVAGGGLLYWLRSALNFTKSFLFGQLTTTMTFNNSGWNNNEQQFLSFLDWFQKSHWARWSRAMSLDSPGFKGEIIIGAGFGYHFFFRNGTFFWFRKHKLDSSGATTEKMEITITALTRNRQKLIELVEEFRFKEDEKRVYVETWGKDGGWDNRVYIPERKLEHVILKASTKAELIKRITWWIDNEAWYRERGLAYKLCIVLEGPPGTGKSSLLRALSCEFQRSLFSLNLNNMSDQTLQAAFSKIKPGSIIAMEDYDSSKSVQRRAGMDVHERSSRKKLDDVPADPTKKNSAKSEIVAAMDDFAFLTTSGILNIMDGIVPLDNVIVIMTTNRIGLIDPAMLRAGRTDYVFNIPLLTTTEIYEYANKMFPGHAFEYGFQFEDIAGCDLEKLFKENPYDPVSFFNSIPVAGTVVEIASRAEQAEVA